MTDDLSDALDILSAAKEAFEDADRREMAARSARTDALNRLNAAQKHFDKLIAGIKSHAPRDSDWKKP
jgi:hypothetical protein